MYKSKKYFKIIAAITFICVLLCVFAKPATINTVSGVSDKITLVIDAGHGGLDGGAVSQTGLKESDVNLAIALKLRDVAKLCGVNTVMIREDENSLHSGDADTIRQQKVTDMKNRVAMIEKIPNALLVSIHQNSYPGTSRGAQVFYRDGDELSRALAVRMQTELELVNQAGKSRNAMPVPDGIYLFKNTHCTAVLAECGFLSDEEDAKLLESDSYKTGIALGIMNAVLGIHSLEEK